MAVMDLNYMNTEKEDIGVVKDCTLDLAFGDNENNFECRMDISNHCCRKNYYLYIENTEYGGIVDDIGAVTAKGEVAYYGRTWHGILNSKVLKPDTGEDYLILNGDANSVLATLINRVGLNSLFTASSENSGITITNYKMNRYIKGYDGIRKMLKSVGAKLKMAFNMIDDEGFVVLSAEPIVDYSKDEQFDSDLIDLTVKKKGNVLNHVICLGKGDLSDREVIHVYADKKGEIVEEQVFFGLDEVEDIYENVNLSGDDLRQGGIDKIKKAWASDELDLNFNEDDENYDIGDIIGAFENVTNVKVKTEITKKIVKIGKGSITVSYPCESGAIADDSISSILGEGILGVMVLGG